MKRIICAIAVIALALPAFADIPERVFELGIDADAGASNSYFTWNSFFNDQKNLVIDLNDMAKSLGGFSVSADADVNLFWNLNLSKKLQFGGFLSTSAYAYSNLPDSLLDLLANGNQADTLYEGNLNLKGDAFLDLGLKASASYGPISVSLIPTYFMPIFHLADPTAKYSAETASDGTITASGLLSLPIYSVVPLSGSDGIDASSIINSLLTSGGVDVTLGGAYQLFPELGLGATLRNIPIVPARMSERYLVSASYSVSIENLLANYDKSDLIKTTSIPFSADPDVLAATVYRPFKAGVSAVYTPRLLRFLSVTPNLDFVYYMQPYVDAGVKVKANLANIGIFAYSIGIEDLIWRNKLNMALNLRVFELDFNVSTASGDFLKSFALSGLNAGLGIRVGY